MKKSQKKLGRDNSGQLLIVASLAIAILISSTTIYVYELSKETTIENPEPIGNFVLAIKQNTRNAMISSIANASNGGEKTILTTNLEQFSQVLRRLSHYETYNLAYTPLNYSNYDEGVRLSWNISDQGVSSAQAYFTLKIHSMEENLTLNYDVNITTAMRINGYYTELTGDEKQVVLTCDLYNEGNRALARNFTFFYRNLGNWMPIDASNNLSITDYGNGTYRVSFTVSVSSSYVEVSTRAHDLRNIFVMANTTCYGI
jgi:hypothetical protein